MIREVPDQRPLRAQAVGRALLPVANKVGRALLPVGLFATGRSARPTLVATRRRMDRRGVTLLDVVITTMVIGILASAGALKYADTLRRFSAEAAAKRIATDFEYARWQARTRAAAETVVFDLANHRYTLSSAVDLAHPTQIYTVPLQEHPYEARLVSVDFAGGTTVTFNTYGLPDASGQVVIASGSYQKTIQLDAGSGRAAIQP